MIPRILRRLGKSLLAGRAIGIATWKPPGHYYSPIPSWNEILHDQDRIWLPSPSALPGIDMNVSQQLATLDEMAKFAHEVPYRGINSPTLRYREPNDMFGRASAAMLYLMLRVLRPKRIVEVGSGFSSAVMLDTNDLALDGSMRCTFIEPYPDRLKSCSAPRTIDAPSSRGVFKTSSEHLRLLEAADVLFVDSSHVSKTGSDVNLLLFEILPRLNEGVFVHFHDIYYLRIPTKVGGGRESVERSVCPAGVSPVQRRVPDPFLGLVSLPASEGGASEGTLGVCQRKLHLAEETSPSRRA
jgi:hypothetical protein